VRDLYTDAAVKKQGATLVYKSQISLAQPDFTSECIQARNAGAEALIFASDGNTVSRAARACIQQGYHPQFVSFGLALVNSIASDRNLEGLIGATTGFPWFLDAPELAEYNGAIQRYARTLDRSGATAIVWAGGKLVEVAGRKLSDNPTAAELLSAGTAIKHETLGGLAPELDFTPGGLPSKPACFSKVVIQGGKFAAPDGLKQKCISY
jgi:branched-chain amino acid transport system substrate-binding protein